MNKEEILKAAVLAADREQLGINTSERGAFIHGFEVGAEAEAESNLNAIRQLIETFEGKVKSVEHLKQPTGTWGDTTTAADLERLNIRIYERLTFIDALKALCPPLNQQ